MKHRFVALIVATTLALAMVSVAVAHNTSASLACSPQAVTLTVSGNAYPAGSTYVYAIDGGSTSGPVAANSTHQYDAGSPLVGHTAHVQFTSSDLKPQFDFVYDLTSDACVEVEVTPSPEPTPTPSATPTPEITLPPTDTD